MFFGSFAVLITSILYHGTLDSVSRTIYMTISGACMAYFMWDRAEFTIFYFLACMSVLSVFTICNLKSHKKNAEASKWHSILHAITCFGICCVTK